MRKSAFLFKIKYLILVFPLMAFFSCRKKIDHTPGESTYSYQNTTGQPGGGTPSLTWNKISDNEITEIHALEVYNGELYVGGAFENAAGNIRNFAKLNSLGDLTNVLSNNFSLGTVFDLHGYNNDLIIGGNFTYNNSPWSKDLIRMNSAGLATDIPFTTSLGHSVRRIGSYNGNLIIGGWFSPATTNSVVTTSVDMLVNYTPVGLAGAQGPITGQVVHNGELYVCGENSELLKWTGTTWEIVNYIDMSSWEMIHAVESYNSELYILGYFSNNYIVLKMNAQGVWEKIEELYPSGSFSEYSGMKVINDELYIFGSGLKLTGPTSGIMKYNGSFWSLLSNFPYEVRDVAFYNNNLYLASNYGLYKYE